MSGSSIGSLQPFLGSSLGSWASRRAEFNYKVVEGKYQFHSLLEQEDTYGPTHAIPRPITRKRWVRSAWKVGIASLPIALFQPLAAVKIISEDTGSHWGVYISRADDKQLEIDFPKDIYKVYGSNWTREGQQDVQQGDITFAREGSAFTESKYGESIMYFSWPEFVLVAQFVFGEYILRLLDKDTMRLSPGERAELLRSSNTGKAYGMLSNNCQHFAELLMMAMMDNSWHNKSCLTKDFCLDELSKEWESIDNSWTKFGRGKQFTRPFLTTFGRLAEADESVLKPVTPESQKEYQKWFPNDPPAVIQTFLKRPGNCHLAIRTASIYLSTKKSLSLYDYVRLLDSQATNDMVAYVEEKPKGAKQSYFAVVRAWALSFNEVIKDKAGLQLLSLISWIRPKNIPKILLPQAKTLNLLDDYGLVNYTDSNGFDIHPLFHYLLGISIQRTDPDGETLSLAIKYVTKLFPMIKGLGVEWWSIYEEHLSSIVRHKLSVRNEHTDEAFDLVFLIGQGWRINGGLEEAITSLITVFDWRSRHLDWNDPKRLECQLELARAYQDKNDPASLIQMLENPKSVNPFLNKRLNLDAFQDGSKLVLDLGLELAKARMKLRDFKRATKLLQILEDAELSVTVADNSVYSESGLSDYQWALKLLLIDVYDNSQEPKKALKYVSRRMFNVDEIRSTKPEEPQVLRGKLLESLHPEDAYTRSFLRRAALVARTYRILRLYTRNWKFHNIFTV
ncbi:kinesin light chain [Fusarium phyllophilum]|uniref:Kinesin light chain n=1 Tax=Fusarium phyllophilum TaxID=47803 RepID=A0A8H5JRB3_9HYPO|nr:kinesin light chain [Fusarium phyllophilum]